MKLKSYFSGTVEAAMDLARKELGEDALLVNARPATAETRHLGAYEVVFGSLGGSPAAMQAQAAPEGANRGAQDPVRKDLADMKREIERLAKCLSGARMFASPASEESDLCARLVANELDPMRAQAVAQGASLEKFFEVDATLGRRGAGRAVIALVGQQGVGKTPRWCELAARYADWPSRKPAQVLSTEQTCFASPQRIKLRSLAAICWESDATWWKRRSRYPKQSRSIA